MWPHTTPETGEGFGGEESPVSDGANIGLVKRFGSQASVLRPFDEAPRPRPQRRGAGGPRLGELLLAEGLLTEAELAEALAEQKKSSPKKPLGEILLRSGLVVAPVLVRLLATQCQLDLEEEQGFGTGLRRAIELRHQAERTEPEAPAPEPYETTPDHALGLVEEQPEPAAVQEAPRRLGELLVEKGLLDGVQLEEALAEQEDSGRLLGEIVVDRGYVPMITLVNVLTEQLNGELQTECGFGSGLRQVLETQLLQRRDQAA